MRVSELREIFDIEPSWRKFYEGKVNATAGGKQYLGPKAVDMIKNLKSTK